MLSTRVVSTVLRYISLGILYLTAAIPVYAQSVNETVSAQTMLENISKAVPNLTRMTTAIAFVIGMFLIIRGVILLKHAGEARTMMSQEHHLTRPIVMIVIGSLLLYLPSAVRVGMSTFWTDPSPYGYLDQQNSWEQFINVVYIVIQFIGVLAFIRGLVILSHLGGHGGQGQLSKGLTHIIGGIFCVNIYQFVQVIMITLGLQSL